MSVLRTILADSVERVGDPVAHALLLLAAAFCLLVVVSLLLRLANGAGPIALLRTRFHEIVPVRGLFIVVHGALWVGFAAAV